MTQNDQLNLFGAKLRVVVYLEEPFVIRIDNQENPNEFEYDGFCIDLLKVKFRKRKTCFLFVLQNPICRRWPKH